MPQAIVPGTTVERYRIERVLGAGSMGDVFCGIDIDLKRKVALKILSDRHRDNRELRARFVREGRAVAAISHPNVVQVFTTGTYDDRPYIAMEFLDGTDLGTAIKEQGPLPSGLAARAILDATRGLEAAAKAGLIHRDVKPSNLVLLRDGTVKVTDFGLAKPVETGDEPALTALGVVVGTPDYIAPEQARGDAIDERVDIYALGGTLYYLLTGMPPFRTGQPSEDKYLKVVARHLKKPPPDPRVRVPEVDRDLARLVKLMMAKRPVDRPGYAELIEQLGAIVERHEASGPGGARARRPSTSSGSLGGQVSPTPFVGAYAANPFDPPDLSAGGPTDGDSPDRTVPGRVHVVSSGGMSQDSIAHGDHGGIDPSVAPAPGKTSRWLVAVTILSALVFFVGLGLLLFGPMPEAPRLTVPDAGPASAPVMEQTEQATAEPLPLPAPPQGMLLVKHDDGTPWFFADIRPVSHGDYAALFPSHKIPRKQQATDPVTRVSHGYAQAYAKAKEKRLLTAEEWEAAARVEGFQAASDLWEWVAREPGADSQDKDDRRPVRSAQGPAMRNERGGKDVTFRLGASL